MESFPSVLRTKQDVVMHLTKPFSALALSVAAAASLACTAEIAQDPMAAGQAGSSSTPTGGSGNNPSGGSGGSVGVDPLTCGPEPAKVRAPMRRLTRLEYNNTVRDLLKDKSLPANAFPSEESGNGFGNDADAQNVTATLVENYVSVAEKVAATAVDSAEIVARWGCIGQAADATAETACVRTIVEAFGPEAWRRPLESGEADGLVALFTEVRELSTFKESVAAVFEAILQSPEFLYKPEFGVDAAGRPGVKQPTAYEMATRLSYMFWASAPDDALRQAAASGALLTPEGVRTQAERLLADPRTREVMTFFFDNLLPIQSLSHLEREKERYPKFSAKIGSLLRTETQTFLNEEIFSGPGKWPGVFTAPYTYVNEELAAYYGLSGVTGETFQKVMLDPSTGRGGLLTQAGVLAGPVHSNEPNPVVRGAFVLQKIMCKPVPKPTGDIAAQVTPPDPNGAATARQRYTVHTTNPVCKACHINMDPIGYALENFDPIGQWRDQENGVTIDPVVTVPALGEVKNPLELGQRLAESEETQQCLATQWMNFGYGRTLKDTEACGVQSVRSTFKESGYDVKEMLIALTQSDAFLTLPAERE